MCHAVARPRRGWLPTPLLVAATVLLASLLACATSLPAKGDDGTLQQLRDDVRNGTPSSGDSGSHGGGGRDQNSDGGDSDGVSWSGEALFAAVASPFWGPYYAFEDNYSADTWFPRFPYDNSCGYLATERSEAANRRWAARFNAEYLEPFEHIQIASGRLLVSTASRFGVDTQWDYLQEKLAGGGHDQLWMGDCNFVFRFAQHVDAEFRAGLGFNWLDDPRQTDFGFNFTYGFDVFPWRPWVLSTDIDWGTLGKAELFRFRSTVGAVVHGVEAYTGYEYLDVGRTHLNCLIGGVRIWF